METPVNNLAPNGQLPEKKTETLLEEVQAAVSSFKAENDRRAELLKQEQDLQARRLLGGSSEAGQAPVAPKVETAKEYAERIMNNKIKVNKND